MSSSSPQKQTSNLERHIQTGIALIGVALLSWIGNNSYTTSIDLATLKTEIAGLKSQIYVLQNMTSDSYTKADSIRDFKIRDDDIKENRDAIRALQNLYSGGGLPR